MLSALSTLSVNKAVDVADLSDVQHSQWHRNRAGTGRKVQTLPASTQSTGGKKSGSGLKYLSLPAHMRPYLLQQGVQKSVSDFTVRMSGPDNKNVIEGDDHSEDAVGQSFDVDHLLETLKDRRITNQLLSEQLSGMSAADFDQFFEEFIRDIEVSGFNVKEDRPLSCTRKAVYAAILSLTFLGAGSSVLGLLPLGAEATSRDRAQGMIQFLVCLFFSNGAPYTNAMYEVIGQLDKKLTGYLQGMASEGCRERCLGFWSDVRDVIRNAHWLEVILLPMALLIAAYSPLLDALNAREGVINLVSGGEPSLLGKGLGNFMMVLNWSTGFALPAVMATSLFDGYIKDAKLLRSGIAIKQKDMHRLVAVLQKKIMSDGIHDNKSPLKPEQLARIISPELSADAYLLGELLQEDGQEACEQSSRCMTLLTELGLDKQVKADREQLAGAGDFLATDPEAGQMLSGVLSKILESPALSEKVLKALNGQSIQYSDHTERAKALGRLVVRFLINWLALNGLSVTFAAPMVVNHYKSYMDNPALDVDCHYLKNISAEIEPFDNTLFELGIGSYMAQGVTLSDAAIKTLELVLTPLSFMLAGCDMDSLKGCCDMDNLKGCCDMDNRKRAWKAVWRGFERNALLCGVISAAGYAWVVSSAEEKYQEYLELLGCKIGVPDSKMVWEFECAGVLTQVMVTIMLLHLCTSSFKSIFSKLPVVNCKNPCNREVTRNGTDLSLKAP